MRGCLGVYMGEQFILLKYILDSVDRQGIAVFINEETSSGGMQFVPDTDPGDQLIFYISRGNIQKALPPPLSADEDRLGNFVPILQAQIGYFADAQAEAEQEFQDAHIPDTDDLTEASRKFVIFHFCGADKRTEFWFAQEPRKIFGQLKMAGGKAKEVFGCIALPKQISTKLTQRAISSINSLRILKLFEIAGQSLWTQLLRIGLLKPGAQLQQVIAVGEEGLG